MKKYKANIILLSIIAISAIFSVIVGFFLKNLFEFIFTNPGELFFGSTGVYLVALLVGLEIGAFLISKFDKISKKAWGVFKTQEEKENPKQDFKKSTKIFFIIFSVMCLPMIFIISLNSYSYVKISNNKIIFRDFLTNRQEKQYDFNSVFLILDKKNQEKLLVSFDGKTPEGDFINQDKLIKIIKSKQTDEAVKSPVVQNPTQKKKGGFSAFWTYLIVLGLIFLISFLSQKKKNK